MRRIWPGMVEACGLAAALVLFAVPAPTLMVADATEAVGVQRNAPRKGDGRAAVDAKAAFAMNKRRGQLLQDTRQYSAALTAYMAAARLRPTDRDVAHHIVSLHGKTNRRDAAAMAAVGAARSLLATPVVAYVAPQRIAVRKPLRDAAPAVTAAAAAVPQPAVVEVQVFSNQAEITHSN